MKLERARGIAKEIGLEVGNDLTLYRDGRRVGEIYMVETDEYALTSDLEGNASSKTTEKDPRICLRNMVETGDRIRLGEKFRHAPGEIAVVDGVKGWGVVCYVEHSSDPNKILYLRAEYGSFDLISDGKTVH